MTITNSMYYGVDGNVLYGDDLNSLQTFMLNNMLNYALDGATITNHFNIVKNPSVSSSSNAIFNDLTDTNSAIFCFIVDEFEDASIDATIWTTATTGQGRVTETNGYLRLDQSDQPTGTASLISNGASGFDAKSFSGNSEAILRVSLSKGPATGQSLLQVSDGSTHITIDTNSVVGVYNFIFNKAGGEVRVWLDGVELGASPFDLSTLGANWYIRGYADRTSVQFDQGGNFDIYFVGYIDGTSGTGQITTASTALDSASTKAICRFKSDQSDETSFTVKASADNGGSYTTLSMDSTVLGAGHLTTGLTSGSTAILRFEYAIPTSIVVSSPALVEHELDYVAYFG